MLLHNQRGAPVSWEANGVGYEWAPYGACELPDNLVPLIKSEGFPVDVAPVPPKEKADRAAALATDSEAVAALQQARKDASLASARAQEAKAAAEAADIRATGLRTELDTAAEKCRVLEEQVRSLRADATEYETMLSTSSKEIAALKERLKASPEPKKK